MSYIIELILALNDNYVPILIRNNKALVVDPAEFKPVVQFLENNNIEDVEIWNTHHHFDHVGANLELKDRYSAIIRGHLKDKYRLPGLTDLFNIGDTLMFQDLEANVLDFSGHTLGHVGFYFSDINVAFVGDHLFSMGCGRLFEGTAQQMYDGFELMKNTFNNETLIYCAHEYTEANARFALTVDKENLDLKHRYEGVLNARQNKQATVPFKFGDELKTNPFLRVHKENIQQSLGLSKDCSHVACFKELRKRKDSF